MTTTNPNIRADEFQVLAAIVDSALDAGHRVTVHDGERYPIRFSTDRAAILAACGSTDTETLSIRDALNQRIGFVMLVYGNEPGVLISDHSDNAAMEKLLARANAIQDGLSGEAA